MSERVHCEDRDSAIMDQVAPFLQVHLHQGRNEFARGAPCISSVPESYILSVILAKYVRLYMSGQNIPLSFLMMLSFASGERGGCCGRRVGGPGDGGYHDDAEVRLGWSPSS